MKEKTVKHPDIVPQDFHLVPVNHCNLSALQKQEKSIFQPLYMFRSHQISTIAIRHTIKEGQESMYLALIRKLRPKRT